MKTLVYLNSNVFYTMYATDLVEPWSLFTLCNYLARFCAIFDACRINVHAIDDRRQGK